MTESEWLACSDPAAMLRFLRGIGRLGNRKLRLFACGCCQRLRHLLFDDRSCVALVVAERFAEGQATNEELAHAQEIARAAYRASTLKASKEASWAVIPATLLGDAWKVADQIRLEFRFRRYNTVARDILSESVGNPFRPISINPAWQTRTVVALAQAAYEERILPAGMLDNTRLAVLADAVEEAGCDNSDIVNHLRQPGEHVRGCWCVDLLLGKE